jgi:ribonuclease kappa
VVLGYLFASGSEQFTESINSPPDPQGVAHSCYIAALVYAGCFCFCGLQLVLHKRVADRHTYVALPRH